MRSPTLADDGWQLEDGEIRHREAPRTFYIPDQEARWNLQRGDMAKLLFSIDGQANGKPIIERMWVVVTTRVEDLYLGILVNTPRSPGATDRLSLGAELPFEPRHVIGIEAGNADSVSRAKQPALRPWQ
jgi:hypothetical protein